jgi:hypothetical protein
MAIDELESTIPSWVERLMPHNPYPADVHVLRMSGVVYNRARFAAAVR